MVKVLNRERKDTVVQLLALSYMIDQLLSTWQKYESKQAVTFGKYARTYIDKLVRELTSGVDKTQKLKLLQEYGEKSVYVAHTREALARQRELAKTDNFFAMDCEHWKDISGEYLLPDNCKNCQKAGKEVEDCYLRQMLALYDIVPDSTNVEPRECLYQYSLVGESKQND